MHAVDGRTRVHVLVQRLQHQPVATKRHHDIGLARFVVAVELCQFRQCLLGFRPGARDKGDPAIALRTGHGAGSYWSFWRRGTDVVYTALAVLVEDTPRARRMSLHRAMRSRPKPVIQSLPTTSKSAGVWPRKAAATGKLRPT